MPEMNFANVHEQFAVAFPELKEAYQRLCDDGIFSRRGVTGQYPLIEQFFAIYIQTLLLMDISPMRDLALKRSFRFVERMLASPDDDLAGFAQIGIIEGREAWWFQKAEPFVGPHWRATVKRMGKGWIQDRALLPQESGTSLLSDLYGIRQAIADQGKAEGLTLRDIPGSTDLS